MARLDSYRLIPDRPTAVGRWLQQLRGLVTAPLTTSSPQIARLWSEGATTTTGQVISEQTALAE